MKRLIFLTALALALVCLNPFPAPAASKSIGVLIEATAPVSLATAPLKAVAELETALPLVFNPKSTCPPATGFYRWPIISTAEQAFPHRAVGKVVMMDSAGNAVASCSGVLVERNVVLTAGHCVVSQTGQAYSGWWFFPGLQGDVFGSFSTCCGAWSAHTAYVHRNWYSSQLWEDDVAFLVMNQNPAGQYIKDTVGLSILMAYNRELTNTSFITAGYPAAPPFDGTVHYQTFSPFGATRTTPTGGLTISVGSDMTGGCSGGPWFAVAADYYVNGLNSHGLTGCPNQMYSPYFDTEIQQLFNEVVALSLP